MDAQDSSILKQSPEFRIDISPKEMVTEQATEDMSSEDTETDKAFQDSRKMTKDFCIDKSPKEMVTKHASEDMSSEDTETDQAPQDSCKTAKEGLEEGSSKGMVALDEDWDKWLEQKRIISRFTVQPRTVVNDEYRSLFGAAVKGDWEEIKKSLNENDTAMTAQIMNVEGEAPFSLLDVAITAAQDQLVENLVKHLPPNYKDLHLNYAFLHAARGGRIRIVKALVDKIDADSTIFHDALMQSDRKEVVWHLIRHSKLTPRLEYITALLMSGYLDICLYMAHKCPKLVDFRDRYGLKFLEYLAITTHFFRSGARPNFWKRSIYNFIPLCLVNTLCDDSEDIKMAQVLNRFKISLWNLVTTTAPFIKSIGELKLTHYCSLELAKLAFTEMAENTSTHEMLEFLLTSRVVLDAASRGVYEIVKLCFEYSPELMWDNNFAKQLMKEIVKGRHVELFRLVSAYKPLRRMADFGTSTKIDLMEAVTEWSSRCESLDVSGAAFLLQRELQWFEVVEVGTYTCFKWLKFQQDRKSYWEEFVNQRKNLVKAAGKWMKDTSSSCSVVATLIITIAFAAAFTIPEGNGNSAGIPIFPRSVLFTIFVVTDAIALFSSVAATLMFLAILTSSNTIEDFHHSLPRKMVMGLTFLFMSLAFMLVAFSSALSIVLSDWLKWIYILFTLLAAFPVVLFAILQLLPLYIEMVESTYWPRLYRPLKLPK